MISYIVKCIAIDNIFNKAFPKTKNVTKSTGISIHDIELWEPTEFDYIKVLIDGVHIFEARSVTVVKVEDQDMDDFNGSNYGFSLEVKPIDVLYCSDYVQNVLGSYDWDNDEFHLYCSANEISNWM